MCSDNDENSICGFICHICGNYFSKYKKNITYHITKKNKCSLQTIYSYEESVILSETKKFHFNKNVFDKIDSYIDIVECFTEEHNYINENYLETIENIKNPLKKVEKNCNIKIKKNKSKDNTIYEEINENFIDKDEINDSENKDRIENKKSKNVSNAYPKYSIFINDNNKYECPSCHDAFCRTKDLRIHMLNFEACKKKKREYDILNYYKEIKNNGICEVSTQTCSNDYVEKSFSEMCIGTDDIESAEIENKKLEMKEEHIYNFYKSKLSDFNSDNYEDVQEYVYMIQMAVNVAKKENIVKIGMTKHIDPYRRINQYENGCKILQISVVKNAAKVEKELLKYFRTKFTSCNHLSKEIFQGSIQDMIIAFKMISL
jgi:hypothetical protein